MRIGFDIDGVLYPWHKYFYNYVSERNPKYKELGYENFWMNIKTLEEENNKWLWHVVNMPKLYNMEAVEKEILVLLTILSNNSEFYYVTSRPESVHKVTRSWVEKNKLPQKENLYIVTNGKRDVISKLDLDYYLEDRLENYESLKDITRVLLIDQPWNNYGKDMVYHYKDTQEALVYLINRSNFELSR